MTNTRKERQQNEEQRAAAMIPVFGFNPRRIGCRHRGFGLVEEADEDERGAGVKTGYLCVRARDGASNPIDIDAIRVPNFVGTLEDDFDRTYRCYYFAPLEENDGR